MLILILIGGGAAAYFFIPGLRASNTQREINEIIAEADEKVAEGSYRRGEDILRRVRGEKLSSQTWMSLLARGMQISEGLDDYTVLLDLSERAVEDLPGNEELWAVHVYALIKRGYYEKGFSSAAEHLVSEEYRTLQYEAALKMNPDRVDPGFFEGSRFAPLAAATESLDPAAFEELASRLDDPRLYAASAVLWMISGEQERAMETAGRLERYREYDLLRLYIAYDGGNFETALELLTRMNETGRIEPYRAVMLEADILMSLGHFDRASASYRNLIETQPEASWIPYLNLSWLAEREGRGEEALSYLFDAYEHFPGKKQVILPYALFLLQQNRGAEAAEQLETLQERLSEDEDEDEDEGLALLIHYVRSADTNPQQFRAVLWELYNAYPGNEKIAQFFTWYLLGFNALGDARLVLDRFETEYGAVEWTYFYRGIISALGGDIETARENLETAFELKERWETQYNLALIAMKRGNITDALERFRSAEILLSGSPEAVVKTAELAEIRVKIASILFLDGEYSAAARELSYALDLDPKNLEGRFLSKQLEAELER
ncbi:MAG: tetratricopeptide repeat protein [bacterium]